MMGPKLAFDGKHLLSVLLAVLCVAVPLALHWTGAFSWKALASVLPAALLAFYTLLQKSPKDLATELATELENSKFAAKDPTITVVEIHPK